MKKISLFFVFGVMQFGVDSLLYTGLVTLGVNLWCSNFISRFSAAMVGYYANGKYTFSTKSSLSTFVRFCLYWLFMTMLSSFFLYISEKILPENENFISIFASKAVVEIFLFFVSYMLANKVVFKK